MTATRKSAPSGRRAAALVWACMLGALVACAQSRDVGYARSVTTGLIDQYAERFGAPARGRLTGWQRFIGILSEQRERDDLALLRRVNDYMNVTPYLADMTHWRVEDYWATPAEFLGSFGGDCEDYVIAKYFALKELGVPPSRLRMVYVMAMIGRVQQPHMVLAYYPTPDATPLILDNDIRRTVQPANERSDLVPVYSFNDDESALRQRREYPQQARRWTELMEKLRRELDY